MRKSKLSQLEEKLSAIERPTCIREIAKQTGISEQTVAKHLAILVAQGKVQVKNLGGMILVL